MADKFPYLARQINGPIARAFGKGFDHTYEGDVPFLEFLSKFSLDTMSGKWLDALGKVIGMPRPYYQLPDTLNSFMFDTPIWILDADMHGFSTDRPVTIDGKTYTRENGGLLDAVDKVTSTTPMLDKDYRIYLGAVCEAKNARSLKDIANIVRKIVKSSMFVLEFSKARFNDVEVILAPPLVSYGDAVKAVFDKVFTTSPTVSVSFDPYFFDRYVLEPMKDVVRGVVGSDDFTITYIFDVTVFYATITLGDGLEGYRQEVFEAVTDRFGTSDDIVVNVV